jgi:hypothetical protein
LADLDAPGPGPGGRHLSEPKSQRKPLVQSATDAQPDILPNSQTGLTSIFVTATQEPFAGMLTEGTDQT